MTATLFVIGKSLIALFISNNQVVDLYDAAGSILALMLWSIMRRLSFCLEQRLRFIGQKVEQVTRDMCEAHMTIKKI